MIRTVIAGVVTPNFERKFVKHRQCPAPASAKVQIFRGRTIYGFGSEIGRRCTIFRVCRYRFVVEKDLTYFVRFENKIVLFSGKPN